MPRHFDKLFDNHDNFAMGVPPDQEVHVSKANLDYRNVFASQNTGYVLMGIHGAELRRHNLLELGADSLGGNCYTQEDSDFWNTLKNQGFPGTRSRKSFWSLGFELLGQPYHYLS